MSIVDKAKQMIRRSPDKARQGVEKAGDMFDQKTGGKYADKVDKVQDQADRYVDRESGRTGRTGRTEQNRQSGRSGEPGPHG